MIFCWPTSFELLNRAWLLASGTWHCRFRIAQLRHEARAVAKEATAPQPPPPPAVPPVPPAAPEEAPEAPEVTVAAKEPEMPQELRASGHVWAMGCYGWLNGFDSRNFTSFHIILSVSLQIAVQMAFLSLHFCRDLERGAYHWCCKRSVYRGFAVDQENSMNWLELHVLFQDASFVAESLFISISVMQGHLGRPKTDMEIDQWVTAICASPTCEAPEIGGHSFPVAHATCNFRGSSQDLPRGEGEGLAVLDKAQRSWKNALESTRIKMRSGATGSDREWEEMIGKHGEDCWGIFISFHFPVPNSPGHEELSQDKDVDQSHATNRWRDHLGLSPYFEPRLDSNLCAGDIGGSAAERGPWISSIGQLRREKCEESNKESNGRNMSEFPRISLQVDSLMKLQAQSRAAKSEAEALRDRARDENLGNWKLQLQTIQWF